MASLPQKEMIKYLHQVADMEYSKYQQETYIKLLFDELYRAKNPSLEAQISQKNYYSNDNNKGDLAEEVFISFIYAAIGFFPAGFLVTCLQIFPNIQTFWGNAFLTSLIIFIVRFIYSFIKYSLASSEVNEANENIANKNRYISQQNQVIQERNNQLVQSSKQKVILLTEEINTAKKTLANTEDTLEKLYQLKYHDTWVIYPKYHGLVPVSMFCEYYESGRCSTLEGHEGAYNIYETEIRLEQIIYQLDNILKDLQAIKKNQYMLYTELSHCNQTLSKLQNSTQRQLATLQRIEDSQEISNYYAQISAENTTAIKNIQYYQTFCR